MTRFLFLQAFFGFSSLFLAFWAGSFTARERYAGDVRASRWLLALSALGAGLSFFFGMF